QRRGAGHELHLVHPLQRRRRLPPAERSQGETLWRQRTRRELRGRIGEIVWPLFLVAKAAVERDCRRVGYGHSQLEKWTDFLARQLFRERHQALGQTASAVARVHVDVVNMHDTDPLTLFPA